MKLRGKPGFSWWRSVTGWGLLALGVLGMILPLAPGIPLVIAGLVILSTQHRWVRGLVLRSRRRFGSLLRRRGSGPPVLRSTPRG
jgi:uncharacterized membrane protein YbaN (DUF454 family)